MKQIAYTWKCGRYRPGKVADDDREFEEDALKRPKAARDFSGVDSGAAVLHLPAMHI